MTETRLLACAATLGELQACDPALPESVAEIGFGRKGDVLFLLTGVGIPRARERTLQVAARERPARILNLGIAGAYPDSGLSLGDVVLGTSEVYGDVGFELAAPPRFQPVREAPFGAEYADPIPLSADWDGPPLPTGRGCTVNGCAGTDETGRRRAEMFDAAFETMEGAAVAQVGQTLGIPVTEIRAISNIAARRDMRPENIARALSRLAAYFQSCRELFHA